jgi:hypothetical protein
MNVKHLGLLSWFRTEGEGHEQDGEMLFATARKLRAKILRRVTAASDPAMAIDASAKANRRGKRPVQISAARFAAGGDADEEVSASIFEHDPIRKPVSTFRIMLAREFGARVVFSATNTQFVD